ncbi:MAG TPA: cytidylate kinase-like family protein [Vicinamibacterales bacterium]|nr:cytidylate kinase-like family protein [Vicinamibacterales bacterium]
MANIIAVSRQFGSGGARIGRAVAQALGFQYADREILAEAARRLNVQASVLEPLEERSASVWERMGSLFALGAPDTPFVPPTLPSVDESRLFEVERPIIRGIAARGNAVIVGRGAAHILGASRDVLRVFLHAPLQERVSLAMEEYGFTERTQAEAVVRESDSARAKFVKALTGRSWCDSTLYDITMDTNVVGVERAVEILVELVRRPPARPLPPIVPRTAADRDAH